MPDRERLYYEILRTLPDRRRLTGQAFRARQHLALFLTEHAAAAAFDIFDDAQQLVTFGLVHHAYARGQAAAGARKRLTIPVEGTGP